MNDSKILNGKKLAEKLGEKLKIQINNLKSKPKLAVIMIGNDHNSKIYVNLKREKALELGIEIELFNLKESILEKEVIDLIYNLNLDQTVNGILVQLPLPKHLDTINILDAIDYQKDVDGLSTKSIGLQVVNRTNLIPCTAKGIIKLLDEYKINVSGLNATVIGRSHIIGMPIARELEKRDATVTLCHKKTRNLIDHTKNADLIVVAVGSKHLLTKEMVLNPNAIIIDVGATYIDNKLYSDTDFDNLVNFVKYITPNPGSVGPLTVISLMENIFLCYQKQSKI